MSCRDFFEKMIHLRLIAEYRQLNGYTSLRIENETPLHLIANATPQAVRLWLGQLGFTCITPPGTGRNVLYTLRWHSCNLNINRYRRDILSRIVSSERFTDIIQEIEHRSQQANQNQISHQSYTFRPSQIPANQMIGPMTWRIQHQRYNPVASTNATLQHSARPRNPVATQLLAGTPLSPPLPQLNADDLVQGGLPSSSRAFSPLSSWFGNQQPATQESFSPLGSLLENTPSQPDPSGLNTRQRSLSPDPYERPPLPIQRLRAPRPQIPLSPQRQVSPIRPVYDKPSSED
ncbi:hypothetical protein KKI93_10015 [Xenorhabdus bovienii]|uniref:hypothetical protein n=1 Tax=Xenorhabdus bovienii TaxID=40576 RepID=UPI0023B2965F|nr:hypothetical protein [Xenorhabdus bovienii]MDE9564395.1 hypothetical protein [Xenorhabdus bovienii]